MVCFLSDRVVLKIYGGDSKKFLQSVLSNDIEESVKNGVLYSYIISPQGRFLFDVFVYKQEDFFYIDANKNTSDLLKKKLNFMKLRSDVKIEDEDKYCILYSKDKIYDCISLKDPRYRKLGFRSIKDKNFINDGIEKDLLYLQDKYQYTIPDGFVDLKYEKSLVPEFAPEILHSVSFSKGCFPGQEVLSRTKYQGQIRKNLFKITFEESISENLSDTKVIINGEELGQITSNNNKSAIAILKFPYDDFPKLGNVKNYVVSISKPAWV